MITDNLSTPLHGQTFSPSRLTAYARLFVAQNRNSLLLYMLAIAVTFALVFLLPFAFGMLDTYADRLESLHNGYTVSDPMEGIEIGFAITLSTLFAFLGASMMYDSVRGKKRAFDTLSMPVSTLERFMVYFVVYIVAPWVISLFAAWLVDLVRVSLLHIFTPYSAIVKAVRPWEFVGADMLGGEAPERQAWLSFAGFILINQALFGLGSIVFNKLAFIKTVGALAVLQAALAMVCGFSFLLLVGVPAEPRAWVKSLAVNDTPLTLIIVVATVLILTAIYKVIYMRSKEAEIIHRW